MIKEGILEYQEEEQWKEQKYDKEGLLFLLRFKLYLTLEAKITLFGSQYM